MEHIKVEMALERLEIVIVMQQSETRFDTESSDQAVDGASNRDPQRSELSVIGRGLDSDLYWQCFENRKRAKQLLCREKPVIEPNALQNFRKHQCGNADPFLTLRGLEPARVRREPAVHIVDPD